MDLSDPAAVRQMIGMQFSAMVGKKHTILHLSSARGQQLNGRTCTVTGHDGERLQVCMPCGCAPA